MTPSSVCSTALDIVAFERMANSSNNNVSSCTEIFSIFVKPSGNFNLLEHTHLVHDDTKRKHVDFLGIIRGHDFLMI